MAKYSFEFKKKIILEYLNGEGGTYLLAQNIRGIVDYFFAVNRLNRNILCSNHIVDDC